MEEIDEIKDSTKLQKEKEEDNIERQRRFFPYTLGLEGPYAM
jgi:hypothetical protein